MAMHSKKVVGNYARKGACGSSAGSTPVVASRETNKEKPECNSKP